MDQDAPSSIGDPAAEVARLKRQLREYQSLEGEWRQAEALLKLQRDLAVSLGSRKSLEQMLDDCLLAVTEVGDIDGGGVYLMSEDTGGLELASSRGMPEEFCRAVASYPPDSVQARMVWRGEAIYGQFPMNTETDPDNELRKHDLRATGVIPVQYEGRVLGALNVASRTADQIAPAARHALEGIAALIGAVLVHIRADEALQNHRDELERLVVARTHELAVANDQLLHEVRERTQAEAAARQSESRLRTAVESLPFDFFLIDGSGRYALLNSHSKQRWGDVTGKRPEDVAPTRQLLELWQRNNQRAFAGEVVREEAEFELDGEQQHIFNIIAPVRDGERVSAILGVNLDISELKRAEEQRRELEERLRHAQKMEAIGTLAGGLAHDFNNILMGIQGYVSLILADLPASGEHVDSLLEMEQQIQSGSRLTRQLLGFARKGTFQLLPQDLNKIVSRTLDTLIRTRKQVTVVTELGHDLPAVVADQGQLQQVLLNLYINAADAMPHGGRLTVRTALATREELQRDAAHLPPGRYLTVAVKDEGVGIDRDTLRRIFEPFFTTKEMGRGTGLGLASALGIMESHGGTIAASSEVDQGTTLTIYLPASDERAAAEAPAVAGVIRGQGTVLLVDDEPTALTVGTRLLRRLGYSVLEAASGVEALTLYEGHRAELDLVMLDMVMPGMGGGEVFDRLRALDPELKVLLCSGYSVDGEATEILDRGCDGFIQKPFKLDQLSREVAHLLSGE